MIYEDDVVRAVMTHLKAEGWTVSNNALALYNTENIIAVRGEQQLILEAHGEGPSTSDTKGHGKAFNAGQVTAHVAEAVLHAMKVQASGGARLGVAFPDNPLHREKVGQMLRHLSELGATVFWVDSEDRVTVIDPTT